jgi:hypothetical protein
MKTQTALSYLILTTLLIVSSIQAQQPQLVKALPAKTTIVKPLEFEQTPTTPPVEVRDAFRSGILKAVIAARKAGEIRAVDAVKIRMAMISPSFQKRVEDLAVVQMAASGEEGPFEVSETGEIIRETINWEGLAAFLQKLIPLILQLLIAFGI